MRWILKNKGLVKPDGFHLISPVKPVCLCYTCFPSGSAGKGSACNAGDRFDSRGGKIRWRRDRLPTPVFLGFPCGSGGKESACNSGDLGSIPGLGRSAVEGNSYPLQYSGLENSMDYIVHGVSNSWTWLGDFHFTSLLRLEQDQGGYGEIIKSERWKQEGTQNIKNIHPTPRILQWVWVREGLINNGTPLCITYRLLCSPVLLSIVY